MPRFAANLTLLFTEWPVAERAMAARKAGFEGVEVLFPYTSPDWPKALADADLPVALINTPAPDWDSGGRGVAAVPGQKARFRAEFDQALEMAHNVNAARIHIMAGLAEGPRANDTFLENLRWATEEAGNIPLTIEPINPIEIPGYFLNDFDQAAGILDALNAPTLALQFDAYHAHRITGDVMGTWAKHGARAAHVQVAGHPGRHEPMSGEIDYPGFFARLDSEGYQGWVSGEYHPKARTEDGLSWII
ncbi:TIM barrel protein [uncultured Roseovarius sp.]|uniref:hydroxypyruvate isomerase family protein n=1 Tax=uncultured Roseovarius sp. TaxID=293344 RepID=UPI0025D38539|nr:TIM barrel protein [uncultured Roseovarius sp.]